MTSQNIFKRLRNSLFLTLFGVNTILVTMPISINARTVSQPTPTPIPTTTKTPDYCAAANSAYERCMANHEMFTSDRNCNWKCRNDYDACLPLIGIPQCHQEGNVEVCVTKDKSMCRNEEINCFEKCADDWNMMSLRCWLDYYNDAISHACPLDPGEPAERPPLEY